MRKINITGLKVFAYHGVNIEEKQDGQNFYINASLQIKDEYINSEDNINSTVSYSQVCKDITKIVTENNWDLIESVAENIAEFLFLKYSEIAGVDIEVCKPEAPMKCSFDNVSVSISRKWHNAVIALGSNMGNKERYINDAINKIKNSNYFKNVEVSSIVKTKPYGNLNQDDFLNGALICTTYLSAKELLIFLNKLENEAGRKRDIRWGARTLDLDIIFFDRDIICEKDLTIPHYDMHKRTFVLMPLDELMPDFIHPVLQKSIHTLLEELDNND